MKQKAQWHSRLLTIGALLETAAGLGFIFNPQGSYMLLAASVNEAGEFVARLAGGGLLGLAIACWFARKAPLTAAGLGAYLGLLTYNIVGCATLVVAASGLSHGSPMTVFGAIVHGLLSATQLLVLFGREEKATMA